MKKRLCTKTIALFLAILFSVSSPYVSFASSVDAYTEEQTWINLGTNEETVIAPMPKAENSYIAPAISNLSSNPLPEEGISPCSVIGSDGRYEVEFPNTAPFLSVVRLVLTFESATGTGTGFYVAPNIILTAGHNLYGEAGEVVSVLIDPLGTYSSRVATRANCVVPTEWRNSGNPNYDYGIIVMPDDTLGNALGTVGLSAYSDSQLNNLCVSICGFPADYNGVLVGHTRYIQSYSTKRIWYDVDTYNGQSGSPVWLMANHYIVVGIHTYGVYEGSPYNSGTRITSEIIAAVNSFES